ncbi:MAG: hypothetical protein KGQ94_07580, partial [Alphaproteobacteria bacterium]|nr:hypothetical protein [Alphaproteobacteria bacterium]
ASASLRPPRSPRLVPELQVDSGLPTNSRRRHRLTCYGFNCYGRRRIGILTGRGKWNNTATIAVFNFAGPSRFQ